jgi:hypothetical protein
VFDRCATALSHENNYTMLSSVILN